MNLKQYALNLYAKLIEEYNANKTYPLVQIPLEFSNRLKGTGGYFQFDHFGPKKIVLNNGMMEQNGTKFVDEVLTHEVAHWFVHLEHGRNVKPHGREWKLMMHKLGAEPRRTHSFKRAEPKKGFTYIVNGNEIQVGPIRHKKIQSGIGLYRVRGGGAIKASDWVDYKQERTTELPNGFVSIRPPKKKSVRKGKTKANIVRGLINDYKALGFTKERAKANKTVLEEVTSVADLSLAMAKRYLNNLWD